MITHVITLKMKDDSPEHIAHCKALLEGMVGKVDSLRSLVVGVNVVDTPNSHDFVLITTFDDLDGLDAYQHDPAHLEVANYLRANRDASAVVDFEGTIT
jgi:hypothetical protein